MAPLSRRYSYTPSGSTAAVSIVATVLASVFVLFIVFCIWNARRRRHFAPRSGVTPMLISDGGGGVANNAAALVALRGARPTTTRPQRPTDIDYASTHSTYLASVDNDLYLYRQAMNTHITTTQANSGRNNLRETHPQPLRRRDTDGDADLPPYVLPPSYEEALPEKPEVAHIA